MLNSDAITFRSKSILAVGLSWVGGFTNVIALLTCGETVSHQTGNVTHVGLGIGQFFFKSRDANYSTALAQAAVAAVIAVMFFIGAILSGLLTDWARRNQRTSRYVLPISVEAILLTGVVIAFKIWPPPLPAGNVSTFLVVGLASLAMGLQNATITRISGSVVRTTHLTGVVTDIGLESAHLLSWLREQLRNGRPERLRRIAAIARRQPSVQRLVLLGAIFMSFLTGVILGTVAYTRFGATALLIPVVFLGMLIVQSSFAPR